MQSGSPIKEIASLRRALQDDIIPLLEEYCYEDYATLARILGTDLVDTVNLTIRQSLLDAGQEDVLVQALLAPCPEIVTTTEAISSDESESEAEIDDETDDDGADSEDEVL
jgi:5-methylcytosine-specific restriction protein B